MMPMGKGGSSGSGSGRRRKKNDGPDSVTYLPIDRWRSVDDIFASEDPRASKPVGGVRIGKQAVFIGSGQMPRIDSESAAQFCDNIVRGRETYTSLLYLSRARPQDARILFEASQSPEIKVRWERLWVLSPFFARLARHPDGQTELLECMKDDLAAIHLLSKFIDQKNPSVKRLFKRLHEPLLDLLVSRLVQYRSDPRRASLLSGIIATFETNREAIERALSKCNNDAEVAEDVMSLLLMRTAGNHGNKLSAETLREKLFGWRRDY